MIAKTEAGRGFRGALNYALEKDGARLIGGNMASDTPRGMAAEFRSFRELRPKLKKAVAHVSLSVEKGAVLSDEQWSEIAAKYMQDMGFGDAPYALVRHSDADHDHVHLIASRIKSDGAVVADSWNYKRQEKVMREVELQYGLQQVQSSNEKGRKAMSHAEVRRYKKTGEVSDRVELQNLLDGILANSPGSFADFADACEIAGIRMVPQLQNKGKKLNGLVYAVGDIHVKASSLGKKYTPNGLSKNGVEYGSERDYERGRELADRGKDASADQRGGGVERSKPDQSAVSRRASPGNSGHQGSNPRHEESSGTDAVPGTGKQGQQPAVVRGRGGDPGDDFDVRANAAAVGASGTRHKSKALMAKEQQWLQQHEALDAARYRITLKARPESLKIKEWNLGKGRNEDGSERLWTHTEVIEKLGFLSRKNAEGYDIYLTPMDKSKHFILVDDMNPEKEKALLNNGYTPAVIQESSENNRQAILVCARDDSDKREQSYANTVMQGINQKYGDVRISGVVHAFRMAGFSNKKPDKGSPFTKIVSATKRLCDKTFSLIQQVKAKAQREREAAAEAKAKAKEEREIKRGRLEPVKIDRSMLDDAGRKFDELRSQVIKSARLRGLVIDDSVVDFQAAEKMLQLGYEENDVYLAILQHPETARKHDPNQYAERTAEAAQSRMNKGVERSEQGYTRKDFDL